MCPESIEVTITSQYLNTKFKNSEITKINILGGRYKRKEIPGLSILKSNLPLTIKKINNKGKFMYMILKNKTTVYVMNTFGLTGEWGETLKKHSRVMLTINKDGKTHKVYFSDPRNFGTIKIVDQREILTNKLDSLGMDLLKTPFIKTDFYNFIHRYIQKKDGSISKPRARREVVKVLMDQSVKSGLGSGIGSYLAIEILYNAKISPHMRMLTIYKNKKLANRLAKSIKYICKLSYMTADVGYMEHMDVGMITWIKKLRKKIKKNPKHKYHYHPDVDIKNKVFEFKVYRQQEDPKGNPVKADKIIPGRTTYWVPKVQK